MNDFYTEQLIKRKPTPGSLLAKVALIAITVASVFLIFMFPFAIIVPVVLVVVDVLMFKRMNIEYEYLYINGDLDIDKIMSKEKRKRVFSTHINDMEVIAPMGAKELKPISNTKILDFTSGEKSSKIYEMLVVNNGEKVKVLFEPNQTILDGMKLLAPRKVII